MSLSGVLSPMLVLAPLDTRIDQIRSDGKSFLSTANWVRTIAPSAVTIFDEEIEDGEAMLVHSVGAVGAAIGRPDRGREARLRLRLTGWDALRHHAPGKGPRCR